MRRMKVEKRRHVRYRTCDKVFAALGERFSKVGRVKDISAGGLAFEYIIDQWPSNDLTRVDIFVTGNSFHISKIPCRLVYDIIVPVPGNLITLTPDLRPKRCGVKFVGLTEEQILQIYALIDRYAMK
ncbi:MAG TPA: PilZ domain-containing protein [Deltaproteobacteria bacterium]|nr:MAG: hypothetical protein DRG83_14460 [Deltaproteobacteria bacterium]HDM75093.1 PilZ domain-containing protein [Deltaproteobacteria bacterium]